MTSMDLLEAIGDVNDKYILEAHRKAARRARKLSMKKRFVIAALVAVMLMLVGCAVIFRLRQMKIGEFSYNNTLSGNGIEENVVEKDIISLQGFMNSTGYQAAREWQQFLDEYDPDGILLKQAGKEGYMQPDEYESYMCYTQEMIEKIDEICAKYQLKTLGACYMPDSIEELFAAVGIDGILAEIEEGSNVLYAGYYYRGGTFQLSGDICLDYEDSPWPYPVSYQYRCVAKDSFDGVSLGVSDVSAFEEWNYILKDGTEVVLALSSDQAIILADREGYFATVNIIEPYVGDVIYGEVHMDKAGLEAIADTFTFAYELHSDVQDASE